MSEDQQTGGEQADGEGSGAEVSLNISHQYVKDLSFESPGAPTLFIAPQNEAPNIKIDYAVEAQKLSEKQFEVTLSVEINATVNTSTLFITELKYAAIAEIGEIPEEHLHAFIMIEIPRLLFPFARSVIANAVSEGGFPPFLLQPVDFVEMYRQTAEQAAQAAQAH